MAEIRCPMCGKSNPSELVICQFCQARLTPLQDTAPENAFELPVDGQPGKSDRKEPTAQSPEWLSSLRGSDDADAVPSAEHEELTDWMGEFRDGLDDHEEELSFDWLSDESGEVEGSTDWLNRIRKATTSSDHIDDGAPVGGQLQAEEPDWMLRSSADQVDESPDEDETSEWLSQFDRSTEDQSKISHDLGSGQEEAREEDDSSVIPDWMGERDVPDATDLSPQAVDIGITDWLEEIESGEGTGLEQDPVLQQDQDFEWSTDPEGEIVLEDETFGGSTASKLSEDMIADADAISKWLQEFEQEEAKDATTPTRSNVDERGDLSEATKPSRREEVEPVDWLSVSGIEPKSSREFDASSDELSEDVPDWLQDALQASKAELERIETGELRSLEGIDLESAEPTLDFSPDEVDDVSIASDDDDAISQMIGLAASARALADETNQEEDDLGWLQELEAAFTEPDDVTDEPVASEAALLNFGPMAEESLPDWLSQAQEVGDDSQDSLPSTEEETESELSPADLPSWLEAMRPVAALDEEESAQEREGKEDVEGAGPLAGLRGILPAEPDIARTGKPPAFSSKLLVTESQQAHMKMLEGLLRVEEEAQSIPDKPLVTSQFVLRSIVAIVLLAAILIPMLTGIPQIGLPLFTAETFELSQMIGSLPGGAPVLLAVDYQPGMSGEMDAVAGALVDHLMLKGAYLTIVSTNHTGPLQAEHLISQVNQTGGHQYQTPDNFTNLGCIPGGSSGILGFAGSPRRILPDSMNSVPAWENQALQSVSSLADFAVVVVATENPETAKTWIEQAGPLLGDTPLVLVTSAQAEPIVRPYYEAQSGQVQGLLSGLVSGAEYQVLLGRSGNPSNYWSPFSVGTLTALIMIFLVAIYYLVSSRLKGTEGSEEIKE